MKLVVLAWITLAAATPGAAPTFAPRQESETRELDAQEIVDAIERELLSDVAVPANDIDIECRDGIVTLTGTVGDLRSRQRAADVAETVKGVRAVVNRIEVDPPEEPTDEETRNAVRSALSADPATESYEVTTKVSDGHVILSGTVDSWQERDLCAEVAKGVTGVRGVTNEISITYVTDRSDDEIESEIERLLHWNVLVDDGLVVVNVEEGEVRLGGIVGSAAEKRHVRRTAWVRGVTAVDDSALEVARWARDEDLRKDKFVAKPDDRVRDAVKAALRQDPRVSSFKVDISVSDGVVTLRGVVGDLKARRSAEQDARNTVGVASVSNHLKVRPEVERKAAEIADGVRQALSNDPDVQRLDVTVSVREGTVHLYGQVGSYYEKGQADDLASRVTGVTDVVNNLLVEDRPYPFDPYVDPWNIHGFPWYAHSPFTTFKSDPEIRRDVESELFWSPFVDEEAIVVRVDGGVVTLSGTVSSWREAATARDNAYEAGATYVRNELRVEAEGEPENA